MFDWLSSMWSSMPTLYGPGRNAPIGEGNLKRFLEQRPTQVIIVTQDVITQTRSGLRPTITNERPPLSNKPAIMQEFDMVFSQGFRAFFESRRQQKGQPETTEANNDENSISSSAEEEEWYSDSSEEKVEDQLLKSEIMESASI